MTAPAYSHIPRECRYDAVYVHKAFRSGASKGGMWADMPHMTQDELLALAKFIHGILKRQDLEGSNKASFLAGTNHEIRGAEAQKIQPYKDWAAWHYHCGPGYGDAGVEPTEWCLFANMKGRQSPEVIHYSKKKVQPPPEREITIIGFSRTHVPFPEPLEPGNPLMSRLKSLGTSERC